MTAEETFVTDALKKGIVADFDARLGSEPDIRVEAKWDAARTLTSDFINELCIGANKAGNSYPRGIRIQGARITGDIDLKTASIDALLLLQRCRIEGSVSLRDAITRLVNFAQSRLEKNLDADRIRSSGGVYLRNHFCCRGEVRLSAAVIEGDLDCTDGRIRSRTGLALRCDRMRVTGSVFFTKFASRGEVRLLDAAVGANVVCTCATMTNTRGVALFADNARITGSLVMDTWNAAPVGQISLRNASAGILQLGSKTSTWPKPQSVRAQGFRYSSLSSDTAVDLELCKLWLGVLSRDPFSPQPYEKCGQALREIGLTDDAKEIGILRRRIQRDLPGVGGMRRFGDTILEKTIGYGFRPGRSVMMLAVLALTGALVFKAANSAGAMVPSDSSVYSSNDYKSSRLLPRGYPPLNSVVYSLDALLPIIDFQQDSKWRPDVSAVADYTVAGQAVNHVPAGRIALVYLWLQIALGWILSTLLVASVTGLIRKE